MTEKTAFDPSEYDLTITRSFDAPRETVWEAWTDPDQIAQWWGPEQFTVPHCELNVRPGGEFHIDMEAPDGTIYPDTGVFEVVEKPERLVFLSQVFERDDGTYQMVVQHTATFEDRGETTAFTLESEVQSATDEMARHLEGMEVGWTGSFDKLDDYLARAG